MVRNYSEIGVNGMMAGRRNGDGIKSFCTIKNQLSVVRRPFQIRLSVPGNEYFRSQSISVFCIANEERERSGGLGIKGKEEGGNKNEEEPFFHKRIYVNSQKTYDLYKKGRKRCN